MNNESSQSIVCERILCEFVIFEQFKQCKKSCVFFSSLSFLAKMGPGERWTQDDFGWSSWSMWSVTIDFWSLNRTGWSYQIGKWPAGRKLRSSWLADTPRRHSHTARLPRPQNDDDKWRACRPAKIEDPPTETTSSFQAHFVKLTWLNQSENSIAKLNGDLPFNQH